jgi:hypothetical protein
MGKRKPQDKLRAQGNSEGETFTSWRKREGTDKQFRMSNVPA